MDDCFSDASACVWLFNDLKIQWIGSTWKYISCIKARQNAKICLGHAIHTCIQYYFSFVAKLPNTLCKKCPTKGWWFCWWFTLTRWQVPFPQWGWAFGCSSTGCNCECFGPSGLLATVSRPTMAGDRTETLWIFQWWNFQMLYRWQVHPSWLSWKIKRKLWKRMFWKKKNIQ